MNADSGLVAANRVVDALPGGVIQWKSGRGDFDGRGSTTFGVERKTSTALAKTAVSATIPELERTTPTPLATCRQPLQYAVKTEEIAGKIIHVSVQGPDGVPYKFVRYREDPVHGWIEPLDSGVYQMHAKLYGADGASVAQLDESIKFVEFANERDRGAELLAAVDKLIHDHEAVRLAGIERSARLAEDRWEGLLRRMEMGEENQKLLAGEVQGHLSHLDWLLACGRRAAEICESASEPVEIIVWQLEHPWAQHSPTSSAPPEHPQNELRVVTEPRSHEATVVAIANVTGRSLNVRVSLDEWLDSDAAKNGPTSDMITLRHVVHVPTAREQMSPDVLPKLDEAGVLTIPAGESVLLWMDWAANESLPGTYGSNLHIRALTVEGHVSTTPLVWEILPYALPKQKPLWFHVWAYNNPLLGDAEAVWQDLIDHHMNVFDLPLPSVTYDHNGDIGTLDFSGADSVIAKAPEGSFYLWHGGETIVAAVDEAPGVGSDAWRKGYEQFANAWVAHLAEKGVGYDRHANYIIDEPGIDGGFKVDYFERVARIWKSIDPQLLIYSNPGGGATRGHIKRIVEFADILGPGWGEYRGIPDVYHPGDETVPTATEPNEFIDTMVNDSQMMWTYRCSDGGKDFLRMSYYWEPIWQGPSFNLNGLGFWSYAGRQTDFWQGPTPNNSDWELVYSGSSGPVPSRRWQGLRIGIEDDARLRMVLIAADRAREGGDAKRADSLTDRRTHLIDKVLKSGIDERVISDVRTELRAILVEEMGG